MKTLMCLMVVFMAGCVAQGQWTNLSRTQEQANLDYYECQKDADQYAANQGSPGNPFMIVGRLPQCLQAHGYTWVPTGAAK